MAFPEPPSLFLLFHLFLGTRLCFHPLLMVGVTINLDLLGVCLIGQTCTLSWPNSSFVGVKDAPVGRVLKSLQSK